MFSISLKCFQNDLGKMMRMFLKDFTVDLFCGPRDWRVVLPGLGDITIFLGGRAQYLG